MIVRFSSIHIYACTSNCQPINSLILFHIIWYMDGCFHCCCCSRCYHRRRRRRRRCSFSDLTRRWRRKCVFTCACLKVRIDPSTDNTSSEWDCSIFENRKWLIWISRWNCKCVHNDICSSDLIGTFNYSSNKQKNCLLFTIKWDTSAERFKLKIFQQWEHIKYTLSIRRVIAVLCLASTQCEPSDTAALQIEAYTHTHRYKFYAFLFIFFSASVYIVAYYDDDDTH